MTAAVETTNLGKRYRRTWALHDCSLSVPAGRIVALVGPNGAGKTTLLNLVAGLSRPTRGTLRLFGSMAVGGPDALAQVGYMAQSKPLYDSFRVEDILTLGRRLNRGWDQGWARERLRSLDIPLRRPVGKLSGGQQAHVALVLAVAKCPRLLLLDEPLSSLDPVARHGVMRSLMESAAEREMTVVLSSHIVAELRLTCDWLVAINGGRVQVSGDIDELVGAHRILSGPSEAVLPERLAVVSRTETGRHVTLLARLDKRPLDPRWTVHDTNLEELVLAYLQEPQSSLLPGPTAVES